ncbi:hypothetical protein CPC197_0331B, partial [Chlamydia psittaci C1/97]
ERSRGSRKWCY